MRPVGMVRSTSRQMRAGTIPSIWSIPSQRLAAGEAEAMSGNIVVCCDGTSNKFSARRTNVAKLCFVMEQKSGEQEVYYHPGLGTMEPPGALTNWAIRSTKFLGLVFGYGLQADIRDAYVFLRNHYRPGDRVYVFGFSRGAYTARAVTSLLYMYGLLRPGNEPLVPYAIRMMLGVNDIKENTPGRGIPATDKSAIDEVWQLVLEFKLTFSIECILHFVGLWDTVNSVWFLSDGFHIPYAAGDPDIAVARHALSMDERRGIFRPTGWFPKEPRDAWVSGPKDLLVVWFRGDHSDFGGGYPEKEANQTKNALNWMVCEAIAHGLACD